MRVAPSRKCEPRRAHIALRGAERAGQQHSAAGTGSATAALTTMSGPTKLPTVPLASQPLPALKVITTDKEKTGGIKMAVNKWAEA